MSELAGLANNPGVKFELPQRKDLLSLLSIFGSINDQDPRHLFPAFLVDKNSRPDPTPSQAPHELSQTVSPYQVRRTVIYIYMPHDFVTTAVGFLWFTRVHTHLQSL